MTETIRLVPVKDTEEDRAALWAMMVQREEDPDINISHKGLPTYEQHIRFVTDPPFCHWRKIVVDDQTAGFVSANDRNEIGILLYRHYRGRRIGPEAVRQFMLEVDPLPAKAGVRRGYWCANINPANERSIRMFEGLGFKLAQHTYVREP